MSAHAETGGHEGPPAGYGTIGHLDRVMIGVIVALASEIMLFGAFFTAFFYVRYSNYPVYPPEPFEMPVDGTAINTAILISSSFTMHWALGLATLVFVYNMIASWRGGPRASANPWKALTLEWQVSSPPPIFNFDEIPQVVGGPYEYGVPGARHAVLGGAAREAELEEVGAR
jgi:heme/copper-type cytochrome/quinol oxidase subunit 1